MIQHYGDHENPLMQVIIQDRVKIFLMIVQVREISRLMVKLRLTFLTTHLVQLGRLRISVPVLIRPMLVMKRKMKILASKRDIYHLQVKYVKMKTYVYR